MGHQLTCDRCGKVKPTDEADYEIHITKVRNSRYGYDKAQNLCKGCFKAFEIFMHKKK